MQTLGEFFYNNFEKYKDNIYHFDADFEESKTYSNLLQRTCRLAIQFQKMNITSNDVIANCSYNNLDCVVPVLSALYLGATTVNIEPSPTITIAEMKHFIGNVNPTLFFIEETALDLIEKCLDGLEIRPKIFVYGKSSRYETFSDLMAKQQENEDAFRPLKFDTSLRAIIYFTSGSSGVPKAVCHSHRSFLNVLKNFCEWRLDVVKILDYCPFAWICGMLFLAATSSTGGCRVFTRYAKPDKILSLIQKHKIHSIFFMPYFVQQLLDLQEVENYDLSSLTQILSWGNPVSHALKLRAQQILPNVTVLTGYGLTEVGQVSCFQPDTQKVLIYSKIGCNGEPYPTFSIKIVDFNTGERLGPNEKGEIRLKSNSMMMEYLNRDTSTDFDEEGYFKTGDLGYYDEDNCIYMVERLKAMLRYKDQEIVPAVVEDVLLQHPGVAEAVVFGTVSENKELGKMPTACIVLKKGYESVTADEIKEFVAKRVFEHEQLDGGVYVCEELPKTSNGKVARIEVQKKYAKKQ